MTDQPGWISLLSDVRERFEKLSRGEVSLRFYAAPIGKPLTPFGQGHPLGRQWQDNVVLMGGLPPYTLYPAHCSFHLHANPVAPNEGYRRVHHAYRDEFTRLAQEGWALLPGHVRRLALGASELDGWLALVYRLLKEAGTGSVFWSEELAGIEIDLAKASVLAIRELARRERAGTLSDRPHEVLALTQWLAERAGWFRQWFENPQEFQPNARHVEELLYITGLPVPSGEENVKVWTGQLQFRFVQWILYIAHTSLNTWGGFGPTGLVKRAR